MSGSTATDPSHPLQRWIDSTFGDFPLSLPGSPRTVLQEQIFIVLQVAIRSDSMPLALLDRLARAAALILTTTDADHRREQLEDLLDELPLPADRLSRIIYVIARLPPQPPDDYFPAAD